MLKIIARRLLIGGLIFAVLAAIVTYGLYRYGLYATLPDKADGYIYTVRSGMSLTQVARELNKAGVLNHAAALSWVLVSRLKKQSGHLKAGEYQFPPDLTAQALLTMLLRGDNTINYSITLVEGWNFKQMLAAIHANEKLEHELKGLSDAEIMDKLGYGGQHPEGRFYPDTYSFHADMTDTALLKLAYKKMQYELAQAWAERVDGLPLKSAEEALILASIVEKETGAGAERPLIAGVFIARLNKGMRLQTDPTVIYGMGDNYQGNITSADLKRDTPYNTYTRAGLPPTPIAMPGRAALQAAVKPEMADYLYFVAKGEGLHYFSKNLKEHECAVIRYQLKRGSARWQARCDIYQSCDACR
jgi:UPF0755 protein